MRSKLNWLYIIIAISVIFFDQLTKNLIISSLYEGEIVRVIGDQFRFWYVYNYGGAMGTNLGASWIYLILTIIAIVVIIRYFIKIEKDKILLKSGIALIFGGAVGNLIDRIRFGKVVDFLDVNIPDVPFIGLERWYTFNIADAAITIGILIFGLSIIIKKKDDTEHTGDTISGV